MTLINGSLSATTEADMYCIRVTDFQNFSASTVGLSTLDTQLFLFNGNGLGVTHDDDDPAGGLQSTITGQFLTGNGIYFLAVSRFDYDPGSAGGDIWLDTPFNVERAPDGPGAAGALTGWSGTGTTAGAYGIALRGAAYHAVPEPASMAVLGMGALAMLRRRKKA